MGTVAMDSRVAWFIVILLQITCAYPQTSNRLLPGEDSKNSKTDEVKPVTENEITKKPDLDTEQPDIKSDKYERGNPIFRDEPIHLHGYTWVLILVASEVVMVEILEGLHPQGPKIFGGADSPSAPLRSQL